MYIFAYNNYNINRKRIMKPETESALLELCVYSLALIVAILLFILNPL